MHSIYVYTDIYQGLKIFANSYIYIYILLFWIAAIKKRITKQNAMRVSLNVIASNNLLCEIVSRSSCARILYFYVSNLLNTVPNSFGD